MKRRILYAGDDAAVWAGLSAIATSQPEAWEFVFVRTGAEGVAAMADGSWFDAVIAALRLPDMLGTRMLEEAAKRHPKALRFIRGDLLSGPSAMKCLGTTQQFLAQNTDANEIIVGLERAFALAAWLPLDAVHLRLAEVKKVPSPPELYFKVVNELQSPHGSVDTVGILISKDAAMTAKLLQMVNSASFGLHRQITDPIEAVMHLGMQTTKSMILLAHSFSYFDGVNTRDFVVEDLWRHSALTAQFAQWISQAENVDVDQVNEAYTAGLLHDLGKLVLAANFPDLFQQALAQARKSGMSSGESERAVLGFTHAELAACLMAIWGLPAAIVEAIALHHTPVALLSNTFSPLTAVHVGNALARAARDKSTIGEEDEVDWDYLEALGVADRFDAWKTLCADRLARAED